MLVIDELDSVIQHVTKGKLSSNSDYESLHKVISLDCNKIFMDAFLTQSHIDLVKSINPRLPVHQVVNGMKAIPEKSTIDIRVGDGDAVARDIIWDI